MGLKELCKLIAPRMHDQVYEFIMYLRKAGKTGRTKQEIMEELAISKKQFEKISKKLREIGLLQNYRNSNRIAHYYLSFEGFNMWLKMLRDTVYNLIKRER